MVALVHVLHCRLDTAIAEESQRSVLAEVTSQDRGTAIEGDDQVLKNMLCCPWCPDVSVQPSCAFHRCFCHGMLSWIFNLSLLLPLQSHREAAQGQTEQISKFLSSNIQMKHFKHGNDV